MAAAAAFMSRSGEGFYEPLEGVARAVATAGIGVSRTSSQRSHALSSTGTAGVVEKEAHKQSAGAIASAGSRGGLTRDDYEFLLGGRNPPGDLDAGVAGAFDTKAAAMEAVQQRNIDEMQSLRSARNDPDPDMVRRLSMDRTRSGRSARSQADPEVVRPRSVDRIRSARSARGDPEGSAAQPVGAAHAALSTALVRTGVAGAFDDLRTAQEAADAIDELLSRPRDEEHRPLWVSLAATLECRQLIAMEAAVPPRSADWLVNSAKMHPRAFGRALAGAWMLSPYRRDQELEASLTPAARVFSLPGLSRKQMASVRGLLQHLEWTVRNDSGVTSAELLRAEGTRAAAPAADEPKDILDVDFQTVDPTFGSGLQDLKDGFAPIERLFALRERLEDAHGSLAEAFRSMDIEGRGLVSFEHFHSHLVKLRLCRVDAEGSLRALELFKLLDRDRDDLLSPRDCIRAIEAALYHVRAAPALMEAKAFAKEQGILDPRFLRDLGGAGDLMSRLATFRRYLEARHGGSFEEWLRRLDPDRNGYIERHHFVHQLVEEGYVTSRPEAEEIFNAMDVLRQDRLAIDRLVVMEEWGVFWPANSATGPVWQRPVPTVEEMHKALMQVATPVGVGGLFSDPGPLNTPATPQMLKNLHASDDHVYGAKHGGGPIWERLAQTPIGQIRSRRNEDLPGKRFEAMKQARVAESAERKKQRQAELEQKRAERQRSKEEVERERLEHTRDLEQRVADHAPTAASGPTATPTGPSSEGFGLGAVFGGLGVFGDVGAEEPKARPKAAETLAKEAMLRAEETSHETAVRDRWEARKERRRLRENG